MDRQRSNKGFFVEVPSSRGGTTAPTVSASPLHPRENSAGADRYVEAVLNDLHGDENFAYIATRLQNFTDLADTRLQGLKAALEEEDAERVADEAHDLTDHSGKFGAISMMKLCVALQMMGRRGLLAQARALVSELETEYRRFKDGLVVAAG